MSNDQFSRPTGDHHYDLDQQHGKLTVNVSRPPGYDVTGGAGSSGSMFDGVGMPPPRSSGGAGRASHSMSEREFGNMFFAISILGPIVISFFNPGLFFLTIPYVVLRFKGRTFFQAAWPVIAVAAAVGAVAAGYQNFISPAPKRGPVAVEVPAAPQPPPLTDAQRAEFAALAARRKAARLRRARATLQAIEEVERAEAAGSELQEPTPEEINPSVETPEP